MTDTPQSTRFSSAPKRRVSMALRLLAGSAVVAALIGMSHVPEPIADATAQLRMTAENDFFERTYSNSVTGNYLAGRYAANNGDFENAEKYLSRTLKQDPSNMEIAGYAYRMHLINGDMEQAADMARMLYAAGDMESNPEIMVLLSHVKAGEYDKAQRVAAGFPRSGFNLVVLPLVDAWLQFARGGLTEPVMQDESLERIVEFAPFIYYQTALVNDLAGFEEEAIAQYNEALTLSKAMPYRVVEMLGNLYARRGEWDKAKALYARFREQNPDSVLVTPDVDALAKAGKAPARLVNNPREGMSEIFFSTASILNGEELNEEALIYVQEVLYLQPDFAAAQLMRGNIYEDLGRHREALEQYDAIAKDSPYYYKGQLRKAYTLNALERNGDALALLGRLAKQMPASYQVKLTQGDILMRTKEFGKASEAYTAALERIGTAKAGHWPIYYARGISYERTDEWNKAESDFLKALEIEPGQPDVMNYLGYSWLTKQMRMKEARDLIEQAVKARPDDAHIIDSMGWALYAMGDYEGAVEYLERAIELMPTDPTVNDHLGDAYWRMGRKVEARYQWKRALLFKPEPQQVESINTKLADGLPPHSPLRTAENDKKQQRAEIRRN